MNRFWGLLIGAVFLVISQGAHAREWEVVSPRTPDTNVSMQVAEHSCPEHFDPVSLSAELSGFQKKPIENKRPGNFFPAESSRARSAGAPNLDTRAQVTACMYRSYFLPIQASVTFLGDWGEGHTEALQVEFSFEDRDDEFWVEYSNFLLNGQDALDGLTTTEKEALETNLVGYLSFRFWFSTVRLAGKNHDGDLVHLKSANFSFFVPNFTE